ncbi:lasso peptide biosynthesis B2 protein [Pseudaestuariivita rosea]|uniref:lasso peptide biosynthesis B2 protein n=1 Tax=Pseudaestuariivita rosea TaxID=2763263 RepID=UPI001ABBD6DF|nr:lasso peptide biosynthesis B2 protein [Pseudaestuariivita rosea]
MDRRVKAGWYKVKQLSECFFTLLWVRALLFTGRFERVRSHIARHETNGPPELWQQRMVAWGIPKMARFVPGATCLTQAMAGQYMLARRGCETILRLSIDGTQGDDLRPHAWLMSGHVIVLGGKSDMYHAHRQLIDFKVRG